MSVRKWVVVLSSSLAMWGVFACTTVDENPATTKARTTDSGVDGQGSGSSGGPVTPTGAPICGKLGGYEAVKAMANGMVDAAKADCRIAPIVHNALGDEGQTKHFLECFQIFIGGAFQCPGIAYTAGATKDSDDQECESMMPNLTFSPKDWAVFGDFNVQPASIVRAALDPKGLSIDELRSVAAVFEATRATLANPDAIADKYTECAENCALGGAACPVPIVDTDAGGDANDAATD